MGSEFGNASCAHGLVESGAGGGLDSDVRSTLRWGEGGEGLGHEMAGIFVLVKVPGDGLSWRRKRVKGGE
jgi:hypothetical protein